MRGKKQILGKKQKPYPTFTCNLPPSFTELLKHFIINNLKLLILHMGLSCNCIIWTANNFKDILTHISQETQCQKQNKYSKFETTLKIRWVIILAKNLWLFFIVHVIIYNSLIWLTCLFFISPPKHKLWAKGPVCLTQSLYMSTI